MISVNDDKDIHFRKAGNTLLALVISNLISMSLKKYICLRCIAIFVIEFDPDDCPVDCSRPCENVCPANAISLDGEPGQQKVHSIS